LFISQVKTDLVSIGKKLFGLVAVCVYTLEKLRKHHRMRMMLEMPFLVLKKECGHFVYIVQGTAFKLPLNISSHYSSGGFQIFVFERA